MKAMLFIDGEWMVVARKDIFAACNEGKSFDIDYAKLPKIVVKRLEDNLNYDIELNRTHYFCVNCGEDFSKTDKFHSFLRDKVGYGVIQLPRSKSAMDVCIASNVMLYGHLDAYDVAFVCTDKDMYTLAPLVSCVRQMGKQVQFVTSASIKNSIMDYSHGYSAVSDYPIIAVDEFGDEFRLQRESRVRTCTKCGKKEETSWDGPSFFCSECKAANRRKHEAQAKD